MKSKNTTFLLLLFSCTSLLYAQDWTDEEEKSAPALFFGGINIGALFPNNNTAIIYSGNADVTNYGVSSILNHPSYKTTFDTYFKHSYSLVELPQNSSYKTAFDLGLHGGINIGGSSTIFLDLNFSNLKYEQYFTILIDDPNNKSVEPTYEQFPIIGEEKRFNFNLGTQISLFNTNQSNFYWALFGNFNSIKLERNYIIIDREYQINHSSPSISNSSPGEIGYGVGSGVGFKYKLIKKTWIDLNYNIYYIKTKMNDNIQGFGINNALTLRIIWN